MENPFNKFTQKDLYFSIITGLITGFIAWRVFGFLRIEEFYNISWSALILVVPVLWILGVNLGYLLGGWLAFFNQFGKFAAVGFTNAAVYFGILNSLIFFSDINKGLWYSVFIAVSFLIATFHSYLWNKYWVFSTTGGSASGGQPDNKISMEELSKFFATYIIAGIINVGIASGLVNFFDPMLNLTADQWANVGGVAGSAVTLIVSFVGVKLAVFKK